MSSKLKGIIAVTAAAVLVAAGALFFSHQLKATDEGGEYTAVVQPENTVVEIEAPEEIAQEEIAQEEISQEETEKEESGKFITVTTSLDGQESVKAGSAITLHAELSGFEGLSYTAQWQYSQDGVNWEDEAGANGLDYTFTLNSENDNFSWRIVINTAQ